MGVHPQRLRRRHATTSRSAPRNGPIARLRFEFEQPRFVGRPSLRWRNSLEIDRTLEQTYNALSSRFMTGVVWQCARRRCRSFPSYRLEADYLDGAPVNSAATAPLTLGCETTNDHCFVWLSYLDTLIAWDRRDHAFDPRNGTYLSLSCRAGGGPLGGDFDYVRVLPDARGYYSFGDDRRADAVGAAARRRAVAVVGEPRRQRGGDPLLRGRRRSRCAASPTGGCRRCCWCRRRPAHPNVSVTVPIGGNGLIDGSFEARYSLTSSLRVAGVRRLRPGDARAARSPATSAHVLWAVGVGVR